MGTVLTCPECGASQKLELPPAPDKMFRCPKCRAIYAPADAAAGCRSAERSAVKVRVRPVPDAAVDDGREEGRPRPKRGGGNGLLIGLLMGYGVFMLLTCVGVCVYVLCAIFHVVAGAILLLHAPWQPDLRVPAQRNAPPVVAPAPNVGSNPSPARQGSPSGLRGTEKGRTERAGIESGRGP